MGLNPGDQLQKGKYTIERELGRGRVGITYLATTSEGDRWVIKILNPDVLASLSDPGERDRLESLFWQEATKLAKCSGTPHIVRTEMPFKENSLLCLPMEYVDGNSLGDRAQRQLLEATALGYIRQIGEALTLVHQQNLVHRDIRPANILLRIRGNQVDAVLTDFGLALDSGRSLTKTRPHEWMDGFSPIELYGSGQLIGPYTDVYSLAATLYELLTGEVPISAENRMLPGQALVSPQVKNPEISGKTTKAILKGMELQPEKRPQSVAAWLALLDLNPKETSVPSQPVNWTKWQTIWAAVAILATIVVGIPAWLALRPTSSPSSQPSPPSQPSPSPPSPPISPSPTGSNHP